MKPTQFKDAVKNIQKRIVSFLSILTIVTLGITGLLAIYFIGYSLDNFTSKYYREHNFKVLDVFSSMGISEDNLELIRSAEGVKDAEGVSLTTAVLKSNGTSENVTAISVTERISAPYIIEGRLPKKADECAIEPEMLKKLELVIGDRVNITVKDTRLEGILVNKEYTITGTAYHPDYIDKNTDWAVVLTNDAFDSDKLQGGYLRAFVDVDVPDNANIYRSNTYYDLVDDAEKNIKELSADLVTERTNEIKDKAEEEYANAEAEVNEKLAEAQQKIDDGEAQLNEKESEANQQLNDAYTQLENGEQEYAAGMQQAAEGEEQYAQALQMINDAWAQLAAAKSQLDAGYEQYYAGIAELESRIDEPISQARDFLASVEELLGRVDDVPQDLWDLIDVEKALIQDILNTQGTAKAEIILEIINVAQQIYDALPEEVRNSEELRDEAVQELIAQVGDIRSQLESAVATLNSAWEELTNGSWSYEQGVAELEERIRSADLDSLRATLDEAWQKLSDARAQLDENWPKYEENKAKVETEIANAKQELEEGKQTFSEEKDKAEAQLAEAREQVDSIGEARFVVTDRNINLSYVGIQVSVRSIFGFALFFIPLFAIVGSLVVFSTNAIIIDEQKSQIGALKALGMRNREIRNKYLMFGITATVIGAILGTVFGYLLESYVLGSVSEKYVFGKVQPRIAPHIALIVGLATVLVAAGVIWISCRNLLKCTAVGLMSGSEPVKHVRKKRSDAGKGSLYSHLIISNVITDIERVVVSIVVIIGSCMLIGIGITMRNAFNNAFSIQQNEILKYDLRVDGDNSENAAKIEKVLQKYNTQYLPVAYQTFLYETEDDTAGLYIITADKDLIKDYINLNTDIPEQGIILPQRFTELHQFGDDNSMELFDGNLLAHKVEIKGSFIYRIGILGIMSEEAYYDLFSSKADHNTFLVKNNGADMTELKNAILKEVPEAVTDVTADLRKSHETNLNLFNIVALVMVGISTIMTFMIMINLTNILVNRRMKELLIMKVNGFSNRQVIGYLLRETMFINILGIVLGVIIGMILSNFIVLQIEPNEMMYVRGVHVIAWVIAAGLNIIFSLIINTISFRRVKKTELTDITKY